MTKKAPLADTRQKAEYHDLYDPPRFNENDRDYFFNLNEPELSTLREFRSVQNKAYFILLLGYFKAKPVTLTFTWGVVKIDLDYIYARYFPTVSLLRKNIDKDAKSNVYQKVFSLTGFQRFTDHFQLKLSEQADLAVAIRADSKTVFDECVAYLNQQWIALPALSRLQKVVNQALKKEEARLIGIFNRELRGDLKEYITTLLAPQRTTDEFRTLRHQAKDFTFGELGRELQDKQKLAPVFIQAKLIIEQACISDGNISFYSDLFQNYRTSQLKQFLPAKACIYVVSFLCNRYGHINDNLTNGFYRGIRKYQQAAASYANEQIGKEGARLGKQVKKVSDVLHVLANSASDDTLTAKDLLDKVYTILPQPDLAAVADFMSKIELDNKQFIWQYYNLNKATVRRNLRRLFLALEFEIDKAHPKLADQVSVAKKELCQYGEIKTIDEALIRPSDLAYLRHDDQDNPTIEPFFFECYLYLSR